MGRGGGWEGEDITIMMYRNLGVRTPEKEGCLLLSRCSVNKINWLTTTNTAHRQSGLLLKRICLFSVIFFILDWKTKEEDQQGVFLFLLRKTLL